MGNTPETNPASRLGTATLDDLIRDLTDLRARRPDLAAEPVLMAYDYGDHGGTTALNVVHGGIFAEVETTGYSATGLAVRSVGDDEEEEPRRITSHAIVLGCSGMSGHVQDLEQTHDEVVL